MVPRKLDRASTSPSTVVTVKSGAAWPTFGPTLSDRVEVGSGTGVAVGTGVVDDGTGVAGVGVLAVVSPGSSVSWVGFDCIELSGVESPPTEGTGVSVGGEIIAGPETVGSASSVQPVATLAARNTPSRQVEMSRPDFRYMVMLVPLSAPFKGQCGMSHENDAARRVASGPLMASAAIVYLDITKTLNAEGIPTSNGKRWLRTTIHTNEAYTGALSGDRRSNAPSAMILVVRRNRPGNSLFQVHKGQHCRLGVQSSAHESDTSIPSWWYPTSQMSFSAAC